MAMGYHSTMELTTNEANKLQSLLIFLLLLVFQEMIIMRCEAVVCEASSGVFRGPCFSNKNCGSICAKEGFESGHCGFLRCICTKDCDIGGGGGEGGGSGGGGGGEDPPADEPPEKDQPGDEGPLAGQKKLSIVGRKSLLN